MSVMKAYEKMFEDGSAFRPIKIEQPKPSLAEAQGSPVRNPKVNDERNDDYSEFDSSMQKLVDAKKRKLTGKSGGVVTSDNDLIEEVKSLKRRVKQLENALSLVMETQTKLLGG